MWGEIGAREKLSAPWGYSRPSLATWPPRADATDFRWGRFNFDTDVEERRTKETLIGRWAEGGSEGARTGLDRRLPFKTNIRQ